MSVTPLPHRPRPPEHQQEKRTRKRREREKIAVEKGNENVLDNWFVIVFVCAIHLAPSTTSDLQSTNTNSAAIHQH